MKFHYWEEAEEAFSQCLEISQYIFPSGHAHISKGKNCSLFHLFLQNENIPICEFMFNELLIHRRPLTLTSTDHTHVFYAFPLVRVLAHIHVLAMPPRLPSALS